MRASGNIAAQNKCTTSSSWSILSTLSRESAPLFPGSENLSETSEKRVFENVFISKVPWVCLAYKTQFDKLVTYGPEEGETFDQAFGRYKNEATCLFQPISLDGNQIAELRPLIDKRADDGDGYGCFKKGYRESCPKMFYRSNNNAINPMPIPEIPVIGDIPDSAGGARADIVVVNYTLPASTFKAGTSIEGAACTIRNAGNGTVRKRPTVKFLISRSTSPNDYGAQQLSYSKLGFWDQTK